MSRSVCLIAALSLAITSFGFGATPAMAYHENYYIGHWGNGYWPLVSTDCGFLGGLICNYTSDAQAYIQGFTTPRLQFRGGNPWIGCGAVVRGWISVCAVPNGDYRLRGAAAWTEVYGADTFGDYSDPGHIAAAAIFVNDGYYFNSDRDFIYQVLMRHEMTHAVGLGHSSDPYSVMYGGCDTCNVSGPVLGSVSPAAK